MLGARLEFLGVKPFLKTRLESLGGQGSPNLLGTRLEFLGRCFSEGQARVFRVPRVHESLVTKGVARGFSSRNQGYFQDGKGGFSGNKVRCWVLHLLKARLESLGCHVVHGLQT